MRHYQSYLFQIGFAKLKIVHNRQKLNVILWKAKTVMQQNQTLNPEFMIGHIGVPFSLIIYIYDCKPKRPYNIYSIIAE